jgi:rsbT co-antagonist protein RsbR
LYLGVSLNLQRVTIDAEKADVFIIDLTGLTIVDTAVARHIIDTTMAAQLLGAEAILTGISPVNAQILITLGVDLGTVSTCGSLKAGLERALRITGRAVVGVE